MEDLQGMGETFDNVFSSEVVQAYNCLGGLTVNLITKVKLDFELLQKLWVRTA